MTSPCSLNRSTAFVYNWQKGEHSVEVIYFGDHGQVPPKMVVGAIT